MNVCNQTSHISLVWISQKVKGVLMWNFHILFLNKDGNIDRFSNPH